MWVLGCVQWAIPAKTQNPTCDVEQEASPVHLDCGAAEIAHVDFANYGTVKGDCAGGLKFGQCQSNATFLAFVGSCCVGKTACSFVCAQTTCTCGATKLNMADPCVRGSEALQSCRVVLVPRRS